MNSVSSLNAGGAQLNVLNTAVGNNAGSVPEQVVQQQSVPTDAEVVA